MAAVSRFLPPRIMAVVDTEEEFDWSAPFDRNATGVGHMHRIGELQAVFDRHGVRPVYAVSTPIATDPIAIDALRPILSSGRALIGTHLHPWVTAPLTEEVGPENSFPGNLPQALEAAKISTLTDQIEAAFGTHPIIYKAGRYGIGPHSFATLEALGYKIDISPRPPFDYSPQHGPDFSRRDNAARWEGPKGSVLSIPNSGGLIGRLARPGLEHLAAAAFSPGARRLRIPGILSRLGLLERIGLTPEGFTFEEMRRLVRVKAAAGQRDFMLCLHSPSVSPGHTPYVRTEAEQAAFLASLDRFLAWFITEFNGTPTDPLHLRAEMSAAAPRAPTAAPPGPKPAMSVQPITAADLPRIAAYWHANLNADIPVPAWIGALQHEWLPNPPNHGFKLLADGELVGTLGAIYSRQTINGEPVDFCNLTSLVVGHAHRARSMDLLSACLSQKQFRFTNFTPTPAVAKMLRLFRFRELPSNERVVFNAPLPAFAIGLGVMTSPSEMPDEIPDETGRLWRDHIGLPGLRSFAVGRGDDWCVVFWRPSVIKGLPGARLFGFSNLGLFLRWQRAIGGHLLLRHGVCGMRIPEHLLPDNTSLGIQRPNPTPRLYRGPDLPHEQVTFLYSELVALPL